MTQEEPQTVEKSTSVATQIFISLVVIALFMPFVNKPFNIDDPLFIWAAKHIQHNPLDFYGFDVNWYKKVMPMASVTKNPPLFSYYLAGIGILFGWSELAMHLAMMVPLVALGLGTFRLAGQLDAKPIQATLISICTPAVMVSGASVMCDVPMVALWVWAVSFWIDGNEDPYHNWLLVAAGFMIAAAGLTKYFGASLVPLLASYSLMRRTPIRRWLPCLLIPVATFLLYELITHRMYGVGLLTDAFVYSAEAHQKLQPNSIPRIIDSLSFTGGGLIIVAFFAPLLFRLKGRLVCAGGVAGLSIIIYMTGMDWVIAAQQAVFIMTACVLLSVAVSDFIKNRNDKSLLLALWVLGTFLFASIVNWTVNERIVLPMAPAAGILISRCLTRRNPHCGRLELAGLAFALVPALTISLLVTFADYRWASEMKKTVLQIRLYGPKPGQRLWFQGHWGFQYYMEQIGGQPIDFTASKTHTGDLFVSPSFSSSLDYLPDNALEIIAELPTSPLSWLAVMDPSIGAGFYASIFGPLPYVFDRVEPETYGIYAFKQNMRFIQESK